LRVGFSYQMRIFGVQFDSFRTRRDGSPCIPPTSTWEGKAGEGDEAKGGRGTVANGITRVSIAVCFARGLSIMRLVLFWGLIAVFCAVMVPTAHSQSFEKEGTVTEISDDRIVVETESDTTVSDGDEGTVFTRAELGTDGGQQIMVATFRVEVVTGAIIVGEVMERSDLVDIEEGQAVTFSNGEESKESGTLVIQATPEADRVEIKTLEKPEASARQLGQTPVREEVSTGQYRVTAEKRGYISEERTVRVRPGAVRTLDLSLQPRKGTLVVRPNPDRASVTVDGREVGTGSVRDTIAVGPHTVRVQAEGYNPVMKEEVRIEAEETRTLTPDLEPKQGTLKVNASPTSGTVSLDGTEVGKTPLSRSVEAGTHTVRVSAGGYEPVTDSVRIEAGQTEQLDVQLQRPLDVELASQHKGPVGQVELTRDGSELVVQYDLVGKENEYDVDLLLSVDGGRSYEKLDETELRGAIGDVASGTKKEVRWAALQQYTGGIQVQKGQYRLRLEAEGPRKGGFTVEVQSGPVVGAEGFGFGGGRVGWTTEEGFFGASYTQLGFDVNIYSARAMPRWSLGWLHYRMIVGLAYIDGVPDVLSGGLELGSGLYVGKSFYVGGDALYLQTLGGEGKVGLLLTVGVSL